MDNKTIHKTLKQLDRENLVMQQISSEIYMSARLLKKKENIDKLANALIAIGNPLNICLFASFIEGAPIEKLANAIIKSDNKEYILQFAEHIKGAPVEKLMERYNQLNSVEPEVEDGDIENE